MRWVDLSWAKRDGDSDSDENRDGDRVRGCVYFENDFPISFVQVIMAFLKIVKNWRFYSKTKSSGWRVAGVFEYIKINVYKSTLWYSNSRPIDETCAKW